MTEQAKEDSTRRFVRSRRAFNVYLDTGKGPLSMNNLNQGGGFITHPPGQGPGPGCMVMIDLGEDGRVMTRAEAVYRDASGTGVQFVDLDPDAAERIRRAVARDAS